MHTHTGIKDPLEILLHSSNSIKYKSFYQIPSIYWYTLQFREILLARSLFRKPHFVDTIPFDAKHMVDLNEFTFGGSLHNRRKITP